MNLLLSGNLTAQASKEENFVVGVFPRKNSQARLEDIAAL